MNLIKKLLVLALSLCSALFCAAPVLGQTLGQWDFNSNNLVQTAGANLGDLQYADGPAGPTATATAFGTTASLGIPDINGTSAIVMRFPAATNGMGYQMPTPPNPNGGGSLVNQWTLIMDVLYPSASDAMIRPIIDSDGSALVEGPDLIVSASDGIGSPPSGIYPGSISPDTWYRVGLVVNATNEVDIYVNGVQVGTTGRAGPPDFGLDDRFALFTSATALILGSTLSNAAPGFVNSIQLRDTTLNAGQMLALGGPSASGIPETIPPVPSFIQSRSPTIGAGNALPSPTVNVVLNQGDTTVNSASIQLLFDGVPLSATVTPTPPTYSVAATESALLDPSSVHTLTLIWQDNVAGFKTNSWSFTVLAYQSINLPTPFYLETFDELTEGSLPPGWMATNATTVENAAYDLCDRTSAAYQDWVVINTNRLCPGGPCGGFECNVLYQPPIAVNGLLIDSLAHSNIVHFQSDGRCNDCYGQIGMLFTADINCTGKTNVFVSWHSLYLANQDSIGALEYSIDQGGNWLPVIYYLPSTDSTDPGGTDVIITNGVIDVGATFLTVRNDQPGRTNGPNGLVGQPYGTFICAPVSTNLIPYIAPRPDDEASGVLTSDGVNHDYWIGKEIAVVRLNAADGQSHVRFRFYYGGTCSWYWGVDDFGLYTINTPVITTQPQSQTIDAGTPVTFTVVASSSTSLTYQWKFNGGPISGATQSFYTIPSVSRAANAGQYQVIVSNSDGPTPSSLATLTVVTVPQVVSQPISQVADPGASVSITPSTRGGRPLTFSWYQNGVFVSPSSNLVFNSAQPSNSGPYQLVVSNPYGSTTSAVAQVTVYLGPISSNLVVHLPFDGNLNDTSGRGNNAAYLDNGASGDPSPAFITGQIGQAFQYTTLNDATKFDYATLGYPDDLKLGAITPFSVSMWVNYTNQSDDLPFISNKDWDSSGNQGWGIFCQSDGAFRVQVTGPSGGDRFSVHPSTVLRGGAWHNLVVSLVRAPNSAAGYVYSYVDGVLVDRSTMVAQGSIDTFANTFTYASHLPNSSTPTPTVQTTWAVNLGQDGTGVYYDNGGVTDIAAHIDDLGIWRRALTANEAKGIYLAGLTSRDLSQAVAVERLSIALSGNNLIITWLGNSALKLQQSPSLSPAAWTDVPGTLGANSATVLITGSAAFFKLSK